MRRLTWIATFVLFLWPGLLFAQHGGGGHGGGGGHASGFSGHSFSSGSSSHSVSVHSGSGFASRPALRSPAFRGRTNTTPNFFRPNAPGQNRFRGPRIRNCNGCRYPFNRYGGYGYYDPWYADYYDPWWWWDSDSSYDDDQAQQIEMANEMNEQSLEEQQMRQQAEQDQYGPYGYDRPTPLAPPNYDRRDAAPRNESISAATPAVATVLVFRDQHQQEVQNYAIVGETLWAFAAQRTQKIPLAELDIPATEKANDDRGVVFKVPAGDGL